jgi:hypothetical protein
MTPLEFERRRNLIDSILASMCIEDVRQLVLEMEAELAKQPSLQVVKRGRPSVGRFVI